MPVNAAIPASDEVTDDAFLGGALALLQPRSGYRAGLDAVMLAASVAMEPGRPLRVLDVGAGVGTAGLCVARRLPLAEVVLLERQPELAALADENIRRNGLAGRVRAVVASVGAAASDLRAAGLAEETFSHVIANPPYHDTAAGTLPPDRSKAAAHAMPDEELERWVRFMVRMASPRGEATIVHKTDALPRLLAALDQRFGGIRILPLQPREGEPAHRLLLRATKGSRAPLQLLPAFVVHAAGNGFTPQADAILRTGAALQFGGAGGPP